MVHYPSSLFSTSPLAPPTDTLIHLLWGEAWVLICFQSSAAKLENNQIAVKNRQLENLMCLTPTKRNLPHLEIVVLKNVKRYIYFL